MKRQWIWSLLLGLFPGIALGFGLCTLFPFPNPAKGTAFLRQFSFSALATQAGQPKWKVLEDRIYDSATGFGGGAIARRIVASATLRDSEQNGFVEHFDEAVTTWLSSQHGIVQGMFDADGTSARKENEAMINSLIHAPRRFYLIGHTHGAIDVSCIGVNGQMTVMISITEGP